MRFLAGDSGSFGLSVGASMSIEDTYCHRLLSNVMADAQTDEQVRDLEITRAAPVGA